MPKTLTKQATASAPVAASTGAGSGPLNHAWQPQAMRLFPL